MKNILTILILLYTFNGFSQNFTMEYMKKFDKSQQSDLPDIVKESLKNETLQNVEKYKTIFKKKGVNIDRTSNFSMITENSNKGIVIYDNQYFSFEKKENTIKLNTTYLKNYNDLNKDNPRSIIFNLLKNKKHKELIEFAKSELPFFENGRVSKTEFEILIYDKKSSKKLELIYIHEFITELYDK